MARVAKESKAELRASEIAKAVNAGKAVSMDTVDFNDPERPLTCLEVDFPIIPVNQIAAIEGKGSGALKPIYQMSKWWARRRSSVFRAMLIAAATKAPDDQAEAAKKVWDVYYCNHQKKGAFQNLQVADIFMGGGTTVVEGSRLGMQMFGIDLNPVAWFVVKQELAKVDMEEVKRLLADIEAEVKPQIMPFYYCDGSKGEKGKWTHLPTNKVMGENFDPLTLTQEQRKEYRYEGPEIIYTFWAKHGPCQVTGCGHRTPIMSSPVMAVKTLTVKSWEHSCSKCGKDFDVEEKSARMAPDVPLIVAQTEKPFKMLDPDRGVVCPFCGHAERVDMGKGKNKKIDLTLLVHPQWLLGANKEDASGKPYGGSAQDDAESTSLWNQERARTIRLLEIRGNPPDTVVCPETGTSIKTDQGGGTVPKRSHYSCAQCGTVQDVLASIKPTGKTGPMAAYAIQGYAPGLDESGNPYGGRFFAPFGARLAQQHDAAVQEWEKRKNSDLSAYWPKAEILIGAEIGPHDVEGHHYSHWWTMFNPRQLLVHTQLLKAILSVGEDHYSWDVREYVLGAFQQYLRNQNMFCFWNMQRALEPMFSNNNFHPKSNVIENSCFSGLGRGDFRSCVEKIIESILWTEKPWEIACPSNKGHGEKVNTNDPFISNSTSIDCCSATELSTFVDNYFDLIITDPPFVGLLNYSELSDFFYVWLRLALKDHYPEIFSAEYTPKALEVVANPARHPEDADAFYQRLLTACWKEGNRVLKPGGILAFTFHHSEDEPWFAVLESLFDAGFYLEAAYPIRSDETKGEGQFGSQKIEYDIIHVCRKRREEPTPISWARMRRQVIQDVRNLKSLLEHHQSGGLPEADLQVIRRGKALEYFSRHYGKVYVDEGRSISLLEALAGINQILDEETGNVTDPPPVNAEPYTRQFLRLFDRKEELARDQMQKFLRGTGISPTEFESRGWCVEKNKVYYSISPLEIARNWHGKHRQGMKSDLDQAMFLIGACFDNSGINVMETLKNENFKPHPALGALLEWFSIRGASTQVRNASARAQRIYRDWQLQHERKESQQMKFFFEEGE